MTFHVDIERASIESVSSALLAHLLSKISSARVLSQVDKYLHVRYESIETCNNKSHIR